MSLESYLKSLEAQREREAELQPKKRREAPAHRRRTPRRKESGVTKIIICLVLIALFGLAAIKNPTKTEAKAEVKTMIMDKFNERMRQEASNDENTTGQQIGSTLALLFGNKLFDSWVQIDVSNYIFFSTFNSHITQDDESKIIAAGVIVFGNAIPLKTDLAKEMLE